MLFVRFSIFKFLLIFLLTTFLLGTVGCGSSGSGGVNPPPSNALVVNSTADIESPPTGTNTLRSVLQRAGSGERISFDSSLSGATIDLSIIGDSHSVLKGEVYSGAPPTYQGYSDRDYGKSALYAHKNVVIDASSLPQGITIRWTGGDSNRARVLAVYGDLTLKNVTITGGHSSAEAISGGTQPFTLARGGGIAVWGIATLENCSISGNQITGDIEASRDRGTYGGGIYANGLKITNCVISGNSAIGYGAAGGGIYSVGGADNNNSFNSGNEVIIIGTTISGNRVTAQHAYGGGIFTLAGGPTNLAWLRLQNCTIARNLVQDNPNIADVGQFYYRGGGVYMGGGSLEVSNTTITENEVNGTPAVFSGKPNIGGGGIAATIGNAHTVEDLRIKQSIVVGNKLNGAQADIFAGSLLNFFSDGYNRLGALDFSQILVPVPDWMNLSRKHYPKPGDADGITLAQVLSLSDIQKSTTVTSAGTDAGQAAVLWYYPAAEAMDKIPGSTTITNVNAGYTGFGVPSDDFLNHLLEKLRADYGSVLGSDFGTSFGDMTGVTFYGPAVTWPSNAQNAAWITFWRNLDTAIGSRMGTAILGDDFWGTYTTGQIDSNIRITVSRDTYNVSLAARDQRGNTRPKGSAGDIGAIEK